MFSLINAVKTEQGSASEGAKKTQKNNSNVEEKNRWNFKKNLHTAGY